MKYTVLAIAVVLVAGCSPSAPTLSLPAKSPADANSVSPAAHEYRIAKDWSITLPGEFDQRFEDGNLIFWRPGMTIYVVPWNNDKNESQSDRLSWIKEHVSPNAFDAEETQDNDVLRFAYRLTENRKKDIVHAVYGYTIGRRGHVQMAIYSDRESQIKAARKIWRSVTEHTVVE